MNDIKGEVSKKKKRKIQESIDKFGRVFIPIVFISFNLWYWILALKKM